MNPRYFLPLLAALALAICALLAGCDTSATLGTDLRQAGTSSETQTSLQALADSAHNISLLTGSNNYATRKATAQTDTFIGSYSTTYGDPHYQSSKIYRLYNPSLVSRYDDQLIESDIEYKISTGIDEMNIIILQTGSGTTRSGVSFSFHIAAPIDRTRLMYTPPNGGIAIAGHPDVLYTINSRWEIIVPGPVYENEFANNAPVYENNLQIGWLIHKRGCGYTPLINFKSYDLVDLNGNRFDPKIKLPSRDWPNDSLGFFWDKPLADTNKQDLLLNYHWKFLKGTSQSLMHANFIHRPTIIFDTEEARSSRNTSGEYEFQLSIQADTGSGFTRIPYGAQYIRASKGWGASIHSPSVYSFPNTGEVLTIRKPLNIPSLDP